jgi:DNA-binding response OmpR family regulator
MTPLKILIIDDEKDYCMIMKSYLLARNYQVFLAYTLKEGWQILEESKPDILLLDNNLPDGKGKEHLESILQKFPNLKVFLISAYHRRSDFIEPHENVTVWEKPILLSLLNDTFPAIVNR